MAFFKEIEAPLVDEPSACTLLDAYLAIRDYVTCAKLFDHFSKNMASPITPGLFERFAIAAFKGKLWDLGLLITQHAQRKGLNLSLDVVRRLMLLFDDEPNYLFAMRIFNLGHLGDFGRNEPFTLVLKDLSLAEANVTLVAYLNYLRPTFTDPASRNVPSVSVKVIPPTEEPLAYLSETSPTPPPPFYSLHDSVNRLPLLPPSKRTLEPYSVDHVVDGINSHFRPPLTFSLSSTEQNVIKFDAQALTIWLSRFPLPFISL